MNVPNIMIISGPAPGVIHGPNMAPSDPDAGLARRTATVTPRESRPIGTRS